VVNSYSVADPTLRCHSLGDFRSGRDIRIRPLFNSKHFLPSCILDRL